MDEQIIHSMKKIITLTTALTLSGLADQVLCFVEGSEVRANGFGTEHLYESTAYALLLQGSPNENSSGDASPTLIPLNPPGQGDQTQLIIRYDDIIGPEIWQIPVGAHITQAQLILPFTDPAGELLVAEILMPWDEETVTWNNFGPTPGNGVGFPDEGFPFIEQPLALPPTFIDITPLVQVWANNSDDNNGLVVQLIEGVKGLLQGFNFLDPTQFANGLFSKVPSGETGLHAPYFQPNLLPKDFILTDPTLFNEDLFMRPILIVDFELPVLPGQPKAGAFITDPNILLPIEIDDPPLVIWEARPGTKFKPFFSPDMQPESWFCPPGLFPFEEQPGQFVIPFPAGPAGAVPPRQFVKVGEIDDDGDGFFENRSGAAEAAAIGEDCPENALAPFFRHVERTGRLLLKATDEKERNAIIEELRTLQLLYEFAKAYHEGNYGTQFEKALKAIMQGKKPDLPGATPVERMKIFKHALQYLRFIIWWEMTYDEDLNKPENQNKKDQIRQVHDNLLQRIKQLCDLEPFTVDDQEAFQQICNDTLREIDNAINQTEGGGSILLKKLIVKVAMEGAKGLWERVLTHLIGKSFVDGSFKLVNRALDSIMLIANTIGALIADGEMEEARRQFNIALCTLYDEAAKLDKFTLVDDGADSFKLIHSAKIHPKMKSTTVKPTAYIWVPSVAPGAKKGEGEWVAQPLEFPLTGTTERTLDPNDAEQEEGSASYHHDIIVTMPDIEPGQKAYVVYEVTRTWCLPDGSTASETVNYFRGVVK